MTLITQPAPVMILGCGRSGTSIFGELFDGLGPYDYKSEPPFVEMLEPNSTHIPAVKVPTESTGFVPDLGLSFPLEVLIKAQPSTVFFWLVRHPFDAISSLKVGIEQNWGHHPRPPDWKDWLHRPLVERCAHHWSHINKHGFERVRERAHLVRFEDMIRNPLAFALEVCEHIGLSANGQKQSLKNWSSRVQDTNNEQFVEAETSRTYSRRDHTVRVGRWRENLTNDEARSAAVIVSQANQQFGYNLFDLDK